MPDLDDLDRQYLDTLASGGDTAPIEARMEAIDAQRRARLEAPGALLAAALWYAERGLHVFPLTPGGKVPLSGSHGCKDATDDPGRIAAWWEAIPDANVGIATGHIVDVIDLDGPKACEFAYAHPDMWPTVIGKVCTPRSGGNHWYVHATGAGNKAGMAPKVDYRGRGGYVVAPPSRTDVGPYRWITPLALPSPQAGAA